MLLTLLLILLSALLVSIFGQFVMSFQMRRLENRVGDLTRALTVFADNAASGLVDEEHY